MPRCGLGGKGFRQEALLLVCPPATVPIPAGVTPAGGSLRRSRDIRPRSPAGRPPGVACARGSTGAAPDAKRGDDRGDQKKHQEEGEEQPIAIEMAISQTSQAGIGAFAQKYQHLCQAYAQSALTASPLPKHKRLPKVASARPTANRPVSSFFVRPRRPVTGRPHASKSVARPKRLSV